MTKLDDAKLKHTLNVYKDGAFVRATTISDILKNSTKKGYIVLLWAHFCPPCKVQLPKLAAAQSKADAANVGLLAINIHDGTGPETVCETFYAKSGTPGVEMVQDPSKETWDALTSGMESKGYPTYVLIRADGTITKHFLGGLDWDSKADLILQLFD